jgi:hypothetical protein
MSSSQGGGRGGRRPGAPPGQSGESSQQRSGRFRRLSETIGRRFRRNAGQQPGASSSNTEPPYYEGQTPTDREQPGAISSNLQAPFYEEQTYEYRQRRAEDNGLRPPPNPVRRRPESTVSSLETMSTQRLNPEDMINTPAPSYGGTPAPSYVTGDRRSSPAPTSGSDGQQSSAPPSYHTGNGNGNGNGYGYGYGNGNENGGQLLSVPGPSNTQRPAQAQPPSDKQSTSSGSGGDMPVATSPFQTNYPPGMGNRGAQVFGPPQGYDPTAGPGPGTGSGGANQQYGGSYSQPGQSSGAGPSTQQYRY